MDATSSCVIRRTSPHRDGVLPSHWHSNDNWLLQILVAGGANMTVKDDNRKTPLDVVCAAADATCSDEERHALIELLTPRRRSFND